MAQIETFTARQTLKVCQGFQGEARIEGFPPLAFDEPADLGGTNTAPAPIDYLLTAVGGCLLSSLSFCVQKKRVQAAIAADVSGRVERDADGLLRVQQIDVELRVSAAEADWKKVEGCHDIFKKYCIVSASVARGIPIETRLHLSAP
ncbi:MAG: OsmC family protein [Deltaproteobacteria bacterium]|nr:OsmC family protein [Deltaproteobacteria bacterium]